MKFCWVTLNVVDMGKSLEFYKDVVGLPVDRSLKPNDKMEIVFLGAGETKVELIYDPSSEPRRFGEDISIGFEVESLDRMMDSLKARGIKIEGGPFQPNPMVRFIYVLDPNGAQVQFVENARR